MDDNCLFINIVKAVVFICVVMMLGGYLSGYVNCNSTGVDHVPTEINPPLLTIGFMDCLVLHDLVSFTDLLNTSKNICTVYIGRDNAVLFDDINSISSYKVCKIRSKNDWQSSSFQFDGPGCFVQEGTFDGNTTHVEILNVFMTGYVEWPVMLS